MRDEVEAPLVIYVDADDARVRTFGTKRVPLGRVADHIEALAADGTILYCWSAGRAEYARLVAGELGIERSFAGFLPKPHVLIDNQEVRAWRRSIQVYPGRCEGLTASSYRRAISGGDLLREMREHLPEGEPHPR